MPGERILIVDDAGFSRIAIEKTLAPLDCEYVHAPSGEIALQLLGSQRFDLVLSDYIMPEMDGIELYRHALGSKFRDESGPIPCPPFILITAHASKELEELARHLGIFAVIQKSSQERDLPKKAAQAFRDTSCNMQIVLIDNEALRLKTLSQILGVQPETLATAILRGFLNHEEVEEFQTIEEVASAIHIQASSNR
ncbi:MAG: response regulator [Candidatus Omnitrophica bacterium]|nr:response regulator [Candidatus Omnitrophota bacterium]MCB9781827.1 response regulator [Candidatus Omnitrophota bacterium]